LIRLRIATARAFGVGGGWYFRERNSRGFEFRTIIPAPEAPVRADGNKKISRLRMSLKYEKII